MSDAIIEEVSISLATTFIRAGSMQGAVPEATNAFRWLHSEVQGLKNAMHAIHESNRLRDSRLDAVIADTRNMKVLQATESDRLSKFTNAKDGMVSWDGLRNFLHDNYAQLASVQQMQPLLTSLTNAIGTKMDGSEVMRLNGEHKIRADKSDYRLRALEEITEERHSLIASQLEDLDTSVQELGKYNSSTRHIIETYKSDKGREVDIKLADIEGRLKVMDGEHQDSLSSAVEEIVSCLKKHSDSIEEINRRASQEEAQLVTRDDLETISADVEALRRETDDAQFKIHEAYSKCMAIATLSGTMRDGVGSSGATSYPMGYPDGGSSPRNRTTSLAPSHGGGGGKIGRSVSGLSQHATPTTSHQHLSAPNLGSITFEESEKVLIRAANDFFHDQKGLAKTLETQVEQLRQELRGLQNSSIPTLTQQLLNLRTALDDCLSTSQQTGANLKNWMFAFTGLSESTLDKLINALKAPLNILDRGSFAAHHHLPPGPDAMRQHAVSSGRYGDDPELVESVVVDFIQKSVEPLVAQVSSKLSSQLLEERNLIRNDVVEEVKRRAKFFVRGGQKGELLDDGDDEDDGDREEVMRRTPDLTASRKVRSDRVEPDSLKRLDDANLRLGLEVAETFLPQSRFQDLTRVSNPASMPSSSSTKKATGISVMSVAPDSIASTYGILPGERIIKLNDMPVSDVATFVTELRRSLRHQVLSGINPATVVLIIQDKSGARRMLNVDVE